MIKKNRNIFKTPFLLFSSSPFLFFLIPLFVSTIFSQDLPDEFRGYKVYKAKVTVQNQTDDSKTEKADAIINPGEPKLIDVSLTGAEFEITPEISTLKQSGHVDFLVFKDFCINGLDVKIEEYKESFDFQKNQIIKLPKPIKISLGLTQAMRGVWNEWRDSKDYWQVTGRVFVFGRFKKAGFKFKRVVPIDINLKIKNLLKSGK